MKPLDLALMCQASLPTIQHLWEESVKDGETEKGAVMSKNALDLACKCGVHPGVVQFLQDKSKGAYQQKAIFWAMTKRPGKPHPNEGDIKSLAETSNTDLFNQVICSESVGEVFLLQLCTGFSDDLLNYMVQKVSKACEIKANYEGNDASLDLSYCYLTPRDRKWLDRLMQLNIKLKCKLSWSDRWDEKTYISFLELFLLQGNVQELTLELPRYPNGVTDVPHEREALSHLVSQIQVAGRQGGLRIESLRICFQDLPESYDLPYAGFLGSLAASCKNLHLMRIRTEYWRLESIATTISQILVDTQLKSLQFNILDNNYGPRRKRKRATSDESCLLQPVLSALFENNNLKEIGFENVEGTELRRCVALLVEVLKKNTCLESLRCEDLDELYYSDEEKGRELIAKLQYLLSLNRCGRAHAQDPNRTLVELISLLDDSVKQELSDHFWSLQRVFPREGDVKTTILFGLLHCSVRKWAK